MPAEHGLVAQLLTCGGLISSVGFARGAGLPTKVAARQLFATRSREMGTSGCRLLEFHHHLVHAAFMFHHGRHLADDPLQRLYQVA